MYRYVCMYIYIYMYVCLYVCLCIYIYIYTCGCSGTMVNRRVDEEGEVEAVGWHYLSNATRLMQPHLFYASFVVSRITITCYIIYHF